MPSTRYEMTSYGTGYQPAATGDFWADNPGLQSHPAAGMRGAGAALPGDPLEKLRRLLRGRVFLAITVAVAGGLLGASLGWWSQKPTYVALGHVRVQPAEIRIEGLRQETRPMFGSFMQSEARIVRDPDTALRAMEQPIWKEAVGGNVSPRAFTRGLDASYRDLLLTISFEHEDPNIALAGAIAAVNAYREDFERRRQDFDTTTIGAIEQRITDRQEELARLEERIESLAFRYGGQDRLGPFHEQLVSKKRDLELELDRVERDLELVYEAQNNASDPLLLPLDQLAAGDGRLADLLQQHEELTLTMRDLTVHRGYGSNNRLVQRVATQMQTVEERIEARSQIVRGLYFGLIPDLDGRDTMRHASLNLLLQLEARRANIERDLEVLNSRVTEVSNDNSELTRLNNQRALVADFIEQQIARLDQEQTNAAYRGQLGTIEVWPPSRDSLRTGQDKRRVMALGGSIIGVAVPLGLVLLLGLLDSRFRYSDDTAEAVAGEQRVTLLGILPNLPDRLSDPNQASIAAHCVHQIRTILQINHGSDESRAFAVTSADRGDGKTSLALALGLSYAASGARTMLIDTDLQGGGLSHRLGVEAEEGIMDALTGGELLRFVCETDVNDLAILPIGRAVANHAGAFSPGAVAHLLDQARRHFDVVICDTGPILGSIEATPVAAACDGTVVTVSRGQSRPQVNKALKHLTTVGATISGLVFNRATASDFERSVSGMSVRSTGRLPHHQQAQRSTRHSGNGAG